MIIQSYPLESKPLHRLRIYKRRQETGTSANVWDALVLGGQPWTWHENEWTYRVQPTPGSRHIFCAIINDEDKMGFSCLYNEVNPDDAIGYTITVPAGSWTFGLSLQHTSVVSDAFITLDDGFMGVRIDEPQDTPGEPGYHHFWGFYFEP